MKFLFVRPDVCRRLLSDSNSRWTPLLLAVWFPLLGLIRDLHPLANTHAEHTNQSPKTCILHDFGLFYLLLPERATRLYCIFFWHDLFCAVPHRFAYQDFTDTSVDLQPCLIRCRQNVGSTKTCIKNMKKKEIICVGTILYKIVNRDCHYSPIERNRTLLHGKQNTAGKILIF